MDGFNFKPYDFNNSLASQTARDSTEQIRKMQEAMQRKNREEAEYKKLMLESVQGIESNTSGLPEMISLIRANGEKSDEVYDILVEILALSKAKDIQEADSKFESITNKAKGLSDSIETTQKLFGYAVIAYQTVKLALTAAGINI